MTEHTILDMCCGSRMFWLDKAEPRAVFCDICDERRLVISTDVIADFPAPPFAEALVMSNLPKLCSVNEQAA